MTSGRAADAATQAAAKQAQAELLEMLTFSPEDGRIWLHGKRMMMLDVSSFGALRDDRGVLLIDRYTIVYLASGLTHQIPTIRSALEGVDVLTVGAVPEYVDLGVILGFDVLSAKPKLLVNLEPALHSERCGSTSVPTRVRPDRAEGAGWGSTCARSISSPGSSPS